MSDPIATRHLAARLDADQIGARVRMQANRLARTWAPGLEAEFQADLEPLLDLQAARTALVLAADVDALAGVIGEKAPDEFGRALVPALRVALASASGLLRKRSIQLERGEGS